MNTAEPTRSALIIVDVQQDFCPGGALAVQDGDQVVPVINRLAPRFAFVVATKDWHPEGHVSFAPVYPGKQPFDNVELADGTSQILWPEHCVQASPGAEFHPQLDLRPVNVILHKGVRPQLDSYSAFFENDKKTSTGLVHLLRGHGFDTLFICGLATDVCVYFTAADALKLDFSVYLVEDACRGVNVPEGSIDSALSDLRGSGCNVIQSSELLQ